MKISLRVMCRQDAISVLKKDPVVVDACDLDEIVFEIDSENEIFDRILKLTKNTAGLWLNSIMNFTRSELSQVEYFQLECRGSIVNENDKDYALNSSRLKEVEFIKKSDWAKIKIIDRIAFHKISLKPNKIGCASEWMAEFVIPKTIGEIFKKAGLKGFSLQPILNTKNGTNYEDYFQLYTENIMPPAELNLTTPKLSDYDDDLRQIGCLTYNQLNDEKISDFNRTAENWSSNSIPVWIVKRAVLECFKHNKLRGWAFRPVLIKDTGLYNAYIIKWKSLFERISVNPNNSF